MPDSLPALTADEEALLRGLWVKHRRLIDVATEIGLSERQAGRKLRAAGVAMPGRGRPKGVKDSPWCDRQRGKRTDAQDGDFSTRLFLANDRAE